MSSSKANVIKIISSMPDDMNETQLIDHLYMLLRLEHSKKRCEDERTYSDEEVALHFKKKRER